MPNATRRLVSLDHAHSYIVAGVSGDEREARAREMVAAWLEVAIENVQDDVRALWLRAEKQTISRQQVADVLHELSMHAFSDTHRAIIIDPADAMTAEAANMLLKSLEEPPAGVRFFLLVSTVARILPTLRSRSAIVAISANQPPSDIQAAGEFMASSITSRLAIITRLDDRAAQQHLLKSLLEVCRLTRYYDAAEWLQYMIAAGDKSVNLRLMLEAFALRFEGVGA